jgi:hypothetical protein
MNASQPKFTISGNSIEEIAVDFALLVLKTEKTVEVVKYGKDGKALKNSFGAWKLDDGTSDGFYKSLTLSPEQSAVLNTAAGAPLNLGIDVRYLSLTPLAEVEKTSKARKAATIQRLTAKLDSVQSLKDKLARLQS